MNPTNIENISSLAGNQTAANEVMPLNNELQSIKEMALKRNDCLLLYTLYSVDLYKITAIFNKKLRKLIQTNSKYKKNDFHLLQMI